MQKHPLILGVVPICRSDLDNYKLQVRPQKKHGLHRILGTFLVTEKIPNKKKKIVGRYDFQKSQTPLVGGQSRNANQLAKPYLMMFCASEKVRPGKWINLQKICAECNGALPGGWGFRSFVDDQNWLNARSGKSKRYVPQKTRCFPADFL